MVLRRMRRKVNRYTAVALGAVARCCTRQFSRGAVADITVVMLQVVGWIHKAGVINRGRVTAGTTRMARYLGRMILGMRGPVRRYTAVACGTVNRTCCDRTVGPMARRTGIMLLVISRVNKALASGQRGAMTARTLAVQGDISISLMIDIVIGPVTANMTGRTYIRAAFMAYGRTDQCVRRAVMTGRTAVMYLVVAPARKRCGRIRMTYRTPCLDRYVTRRYMIYTMIR